MNDKFRYYNVEPIRKEFMTKRITFGLVQRIQTSLVNTFNIFAVVSILLHFDWLIGRTFKAKKI